MEIYNNDIYNDTEKNTFKWFIGDCTLQVAAFISASKIKGIFHPSALSGDLLVQDASSSIQ